MSPPDSSSGSSLTPGRVTPERLAIVAGASRGLGLGLVRELLGRRWSVIATARDPSRAHDLMDLAGRSEGRLGVEALDVADASSARALGQVLDGRRIDLVVLNAGVMGPAHQSVLEATDEEIGELVVTNAVGPIRVARQLLPRLASGATVAFMSSRLGSVADNTSGGFDLYRLSKAALNSLARGLAASLAGQPVSVLSLHPGWVRTAMGGANASLDVATSARGLADVLEVPRSPGQHLFLDHQGRVVPW